MKQLRRIVGCTVLAVCAAGWPRELSAQAPAANITPRAQVMLVRNALAALNHANLTGNYAVLRDLGSEGFRRRYNSADLAQIFAEHRARHFDLSPALTADPQLTEPPGELPGQRLRLVGYFPTQPEVISFRVGYQRTDEGWGLDELAVTLIPASEATWTTQ
jgi:hypothetical protein